MCRATRLPVGVGARAFKVLLELAQRPGNFVAAGDLLAAAWPGRIVEPHHLRVQIGHLRRQISSESIENVVGHGHRLVSDVRSKEAQAQSEWVGRGMTNGSSAPRWAKAGAIRP